VVDDDADANVGSARWLNNCGVAVVDDDADAGVGSARRLSNRGIAGEGVTVLRNSVGASKRAGNQIQQQLREASIVN